jgi:hypothetical protein
MSKSKPNRKSLSEVKILLTTLSIGITLGFWNLFSNQASPTSTAAAAASNNDPAPSVQVNLPPLPTLIPETSHSGASTANSGSTSNAPAAPQSPFRIFLGGSAPQQPRSFTITRSSH